MSMHGYIKSHAERIGKVLARGGYEPSGLGMTELLADARHYCDKHKIEFAKADQRAHRWYTNELVDMNRIARARHPKQTKKGTTL